MTFYTNSPDLFSDVEVPETIVMDYEPVVELSVELPDRDAKLLSVRQDYDGQWSVTICDRLGVGVKHIHSARAATALEASRVIRDRVLESITERRLKDEELKAARAARRAANAAQAIPLAGHLAAPRTAQRTGASGARAGGSVPYAGSVPRNAAKWDVEPDGVHVELHSGLLWPDTGGREPRVFKTIRIAKDTTRGAVSE